MMKFYKCSMCGFPFNSVKNTGNHSDGSPSQAPLAWTTPHHRTAYFVCAMARDIYEIFGNTLNGSK